jgi:hypothetical protein
MKTSTQAPTMFKFLVSQNWIFWRFELIAIICFP